MSINRKSLLSRRRAVATLGVGGLGAALATRGLGAAAQEASPPAATPEARTPLLEPAIGLVEAQQIALQGNQGASVQQVELEMEDNALFWEITLDNGTVVEIDASTGEVVETEDVGRDDDEDQGDEDEREDQDDEDDAEDEAAEEDV